MPVHVLSDGAGPDAQLPKHLTRIHISSIGASTNCSNKTVKGKVVSKCPPVSAASHNFILKTVIQEDDSQQNGASQNSSINVFLFGALAKDFNRTVSIGDVAVVSGFTVGKSPTFSKDKLHPCNLQLTGDDACVYVSHLLPPPDPRAGPSLKRRTALAASAEISRQAKAAKPSYARLSDLKIGFVVNVYGVVTFFKQPYKSRGGDFYSYFKITDQSDEKIHCSIFCKQLEDNPKIFQIGDIVRMHRVKLEYHNDSTWLTRTPGFSAVTFDGWPGRAIEPRTSSQSFCFDEDDRRTVEELRAWSASKSLLPADPTVRLSDVQPKVYFDLTCQLLAKAPIASTCTLLRVWDGTRCPHTLMKVIVEPSVTEGPSSFSKEKESLIANILVYDNHAEFSRQLKPGDFLRIYNLRSLKGPSKVPDLARSQSGEAHHLAFHLHGGTTYGRGIRVLPDDRPDVQELKRALEAFTDSDFDDQLNDSDMLKIGSTPTHSRGAETVKCGTERSCGHDVQPVTLNKVKRSGPGRVHHVRVQLRSYKPSRLHQALKLYCSKCTSMQDVPDDELVAGLFSEAFIGSGPCKPPRWGAAGQVYLPGDFPGLQKRPLGVHLSKKLLPEDKNKELIFLLGSTLKETCRLSSVYHNIVPVRSLEGHTALLDLTAPFLFRGRKRYYGCKRCSEVALREPACGKGFPPVDEKIVAEAIGIQLLQFVLLMKLELQDATDTLDAFLWRDAESFFGVSAEEASANQEAQDNIRQTMQYLCPAGGSTGERPWMDLCLTAYRADKGGQNQTCYQTCYQICHSTITKPSSTRPNANPA